MQIFIYIAFFLLFAILVVKYPSISITSIFLMYGVEQWAQSAHSFFIIHGAATNYLTGILAVLALVVKIIKRNPIFYGYPGVGWIVLGLFIYSFISILWVSTPLISYGLWWSHLPYISLIIVLSPHLFSSIDDFSRTLRYLIFSGLFVILLLLFDSNWTHRGVELAARGAVPLMGNPLAVAEIGGYVLLAAGLLKLKKKWRVWTILKWCVMSAGMALAVKSGSRGQFLGMLVAFVSFYPLVSRKKNLTGYFLFFSGVVVFGILGFWIFDLYTPAESVRWDSDLMANDMVGRWDSAGRLLSRWSFSPFTLIFGLGNSASYDPKVIGIYPHIVTLEILGEEGLIGFSMYISVLILSVKNFIEAMLRAKYDPHIYSVVITTGSIIFFLFILSFKQGSMLSNLSFFAFSIYLGKLRNLLVRNKVKT